MVSPTHLQDRFQAQGCSVSCPTLNPSARRQDRRPRSSCASTARRAPRPSGRYTTNRPTGTGAGPGLQRRERMAGLRLQGTLWPGITPRRSASHPRATQVERGGRVWGKGGAFRGYRILSWLLRDWILWVPLSDCSPGMTFLLYGCRQVPCLGHRTLVQLPPTVPSGPDPPFALSAICHAVMPSGAYVMPPPMGGARGAPGSAAAIERQSTIEEVRPLGLLARDCCGFGITRLGNRRFGNGSGCLCD